jgi:hypothetical protein
MPVEVYKQLEIAIDSYTRDKSLPCSDCGTIIHHRTDDVGGHYFAGIYCLKCWNGNTGKHKGRGGWREIEAKETYN